MNEFAKNFLGQIVAMLPSLNEMKQQLDRETGRRFNAFSLFNTDEPATSRVLAFLLDPREVHGQGDVFLRLFIKRFVPEWTAFCYDQAGPAWANEKIDVMLSDNTHWFGIENKIFDAPEQKWQVDRYLSDLKSKAHSDNYRLVYLSPKGAMPSNFSFSDAGRKKHKDKFVRGAWALSAVEEDDESANGITDVKAYILDWLADCHKECKAENIRWFLQQFSAYVRFEITAEREPDMTDAGIVKLALYNEDNLQGALLIAENAKEIRNTIFKKLLRDVETRLLQVVQHKGSDWKLTLDWPRGRWSKTPEARFLLILLRRNSWPAMVGAAIQAERNGPDEVFVGICGPTEATWNADGQAVPYYGNQSNFIEETPRLAIAKKAVGLEAPRSAWWISYENVTDAEGRDISTWSDIETVMRLYKENDAVCERIVARLTELADAVDKVLSVKQASN